MKKASFYYSAKVIRKNGSSNMTGFNSDRILSYSELKEQFSYVNQDPAVKEVVISEEPEITFYEA